MSNMTHGHGRTAHGAADQAKDHHHQQHHHHQEQHDQHHKSQLGHVVSSRGHGHGHPKSKGLFGHPSHSQPFDPDTVDESKRLYVDHSAPPPPKKPEKKEKPKPVPQVSKEVSKTDESTSKMTKEERKLAKKISKMMNIVSEQLGVKQSKEPGKWLVIWGVGLGVGISKLQLFEFLDPKPAEMRYYPDKPYATILMDSVNDAEITMDMYNGIEIIPAQTVYMSFISGEPPKEDRSILDPFNTPRPEGLEVIYDFLTPDEEEPILAQLIPELSDPSADPVNVLKNRTVKHYGYEFRYDTNDVDLHNKLSTEVPDYITPHLSRLMVDNIIPRKPEQTTVNLYQPGQGIPQHVDTHSCFEQPILSLTVGSHTVMDFRNGDELHSILLPRRSLLIMSKASRLLWTHGIVGRTQDIILDPNKLGLTCEGRRTRLSLTFRLINFSRECHCDYPLMCDYQQKQAELKIAKSLAVEIETDLVHKIYDDIADHFSQTRHTPWPKVKEFIKEISPGQTVLDVGCGNGKYFSLNDYIYEVGVDMSNPLLEISSKKNVDGIRANCVQLPFRDESFDAIISIAVLHHLSSKERRLEALSEIFRVLKEGGKALIYVWAKDQKLANIRSNYARQQLLKAGKDPDGLGCDPNAELKKWDFLPIYQHEENFRFSDMLVPWLSAGKETKFRYYHVFEKGELDNLIHELVPTPRITSSYYDNGNWCVQIAKPSPTEILQMEYSEPANVYDVLLGLHEELSGSIGLPADFPVPKDTGPNVHFV